ncbi:MAG: ABC transporter ATP-binding protein [Candidatus Fimenecus sp.]
MIKILSKFFKFSGTKNRRKFIISIIFGIIEAFSQALRLPAIYLIVKGMVEGDFTSKTVLYSFLILVCGLLIQMIAFGKSSFMQTEAGYTTSTNKRLEIAGHLRYLPMGYFNNNSLGSITSITTNTMEVLGDIATRVVMLVSKGILDASIITVMLFFFDYRTGLVAFTGLLGFFIINHHLQKKGEIVAPKKLAADTALIEQVLEFIEGISEAKSYNLTMKSNKRLEKVIDESSATNIEMEKKFIPITWLQTAWIKSMGAFMAGVSIFLHIKGQMELTECIVMVIASFMVFAALESAGNYSALMRSINLCVDKANEILEVPAMDLSGEKIENPSAEISLENIGFAYEKRKVINDISLKIEPKTTVAFVGASGGGKSTICKLIARFWDVDEGTVKLGGRDVKDYDMDSLMKNFSFVFQDVYLFHESIAANIAFGAPETPLVEIKAAAKKACCDEFIEKLPDGYNTVIGEGGASLSGGEKQRISIARAILKNAPIIILDEATANVDPENEKELMLAIKELTKEKTVLMIAHRLKTVRHADVICVVDNGKIVQKGTHDELIRQEGIYKTFINARIKSVGWKISGNKS